MKRAFCLSLHARTNHLYAAPGQFVLYPVACYKFTSGHRHPLAALGLRFGCHVDGSSLNRSWLNQVVGCGQYCRSRLLAHASAKRAVAFNSFSEPNALICLIMDTKAFGRATFFG